MAMYLPREDTSQDTDGVGRARQVLLPTRFDWPYGGKRVYLTGSFTSWSEHLPMSMMEGCPNVFQVVCSLAPGQHQYKFCVDGEWRHDERKPYVMGSYGIVNTLTLPAEVEPVPPVIFASDNLATRTSMEVDNVVLQHVVGLPDGSNWEASHRISESDVQLSRHHILDFMHSKTVYDLLPDSGKVIVFDVNLPIKQAFHILHEQGIPVAPLWDPIRGKFIGVVSPIDFILILKELENHGSNLTEEQLETHTISAWKDAKHQIYGGMDRFPPGQMIHASPHNFLNDVVIKILQNKVSTVPILHSSADVDSFPQILHLSSLSGILRCICRYFKHTTISIPIFQQPVCRIPLGTWVPRIGDLNVHPLATLRPTATLSSALSLLVEAQVSAVPIVDENDSFLDIYCRSDITALAKDRTYAHIRLDEMNIQQALQLGQDSGVLHGVSIRQRYDICLRSDMLFKVMERLSNPGVRRIVVVEAGTNRVEGIISLSDVFRFLLG